MAGSGPDSSFVSRSWTEAGLKPTASAMALFVIRPSHCSRSRIFRSTASSFITHSPCCLGARLDNPPFRHIGHEVDQAHPADNHDGTDQQFPVDSFILEIDA